jgi:hypothetical protein
MQNRILTSGHDDTATIRFLDVRDTSQFPPVAGYEATKDAG